MSGFTNIPGGLDDECSKCGYPKLLHKDHVLHCDVACTRGMEVPNTLRENWKAYSQWVKPILKKLKEDQRKEMEQGVLLQGLKELVTTITEGNKSLLNVKKREHSPFIVPFFPKASKVDQACQSSLLDQRYVPKNIRETTNQLARNKWRFLRVCKIPWVNRKTQKYGVCVSTPWILHASPPLHGFLGS